MLGDVHRQVLHFIAVPLDPHTQLQPVRPAQGGTDAGQQLRYAEGLDHIVVCPHIQRPNLFRLPVPGGDDNNGHLPGQAPELGQDLQAVYVGQSQVQQDQIRLVGEKQGQPFFPAGGRDGLIVAGVEGAADKIADGPLVLNDQYHTFFIHILSP